MLRYIKALICIFLIWTCAVTGKRRNGRVRCDFIIVGAGSAGSVLAGRLSENCRFNVCLLEAGGSDINRDITARIETPRFFISLWSDPDLTRKVPTVPQKYAFFNANNVSVASIGTMLGGSSSHNGMVYIRGSARDFDRWEEMGAKGWSYKDVLPYFIKSEDNQIPENVNSKYHGNKGPVTITRGDFVRDMPLFKLFQKGASELRIPEVDCNEPMPQGYCVMPLNIENGIRDSLSRAFLTPNMGRPNLHVFTRARVEKVLISRTGRRATGILVNNKGKRMALYATREVILSAGDIDSAKLLMLSGVGPRDHLKNMKIKLVKELPVGNNLHDHVAIKLNYNLNIPTRQQIDVLNPKSIAEYMTARKGLLADMATNLAWNIKTRIPSPTWPQLQVVIPDGKGPNLALDLNEDVLAERLGNISNIPKGEDGTSIFIILGKPQSRGTLRLKSLNPQDVPLFDPNALSATVDVKQLIEGVREIQKMARTRAFVEAGATFADKVPECARHNPDSEDFWECFIRHRSTLWTHHVSTCKMGSANDPTTVVDPNLRQQCIQLQLKYNNTKAAFRNRKSVGRSIWENLVNTCISDMEVRLGAPEEVKGIRGLRVVDASVMPEVTAFNTNAPTVMIAEKAADIIKQTYAYRRRKY